MEFKELKRVRGTWFVLSLTRFDLVSGDFESGI